MSLVLISPSQSADKRSKQRIGQYGPIFNLVEKRAKHALFDGQPAILVETEDRRWFGWLPANHCDIQE